MPSLVLDKLIVSPQIHRHGLAAMWANGQKLGRNSHILLPRDHFADQRLIIKGFFAARFTALEQTVVALRIEQPLFVESRFLKAVIHIGCDNEVIFVCHRLQKVLVDRLWGIRIAVNINVPTPIW